jgi:hypothetical protein
MMELQPTRKKAGSIVAARRGLGKEVEQHDPR